MPISTDCANEKERETTYEPCEQEKQVATYRLILPSQFETLCIAISYMFLICDAEYSNMQTRYYSLLQNIDCFPSD